MILGPFLLISIFFCLWGCHKQQEDEVFTHGGPTWYSDTEDTGSQEDTTEEKTE
jgi:hypothetical protein